MHVSGGRRAGRDHRNREAPCQDAYAWRRATDGDAIAFAVADGLGSRPLSQVGARCVVDAVLERLLEEPDRDERAFRHAFRHARHALDVEAEERGITRSDLATTLQVVLLTTDKVRAAMVGDGAVVTGTGFDDDASIRVLLAPQDGEYANEVVPMTASAWKRSFRFAEHDSAAWAMTFTDGLTRLLLQKDDGGWRPFAPFYAAFLPKMAAGTEADGLVQGFLDSDRVDASWDDDKSMVVAWHDAPV